MQCSLLSKYYQSNRRTENPTSPLRIPPRVRRRVRALALVRQIVQVGVEQERLAELTQRLVRLVGAPVGEVREAGLGEVVDGVLARLQDLGQLRPVFGLVGHAPVQKRLQVRRHGGVGEVGVRYGVDLQPGARRSARRVGISPRAAAAAPVRVMDLLGQPHYDL